jgi:guanylate kinase
VTGSLYVVSGPSGVGKGTLLSLALRGLDSIWLSVSATTRPPRAGEVDGVAYFFLSDEDFDGLIAVDGLLEWAAVHGERYGTIREEVVRRLDEGIDVILEIDPQGAFQVRAKLPQALLIFIAPPSIEDLERRLRGRATETEESIQGRLATALVEMASCDCYDLIIVNDDLTTAADELHRRISEGRQKAVCES